jgi:hypothetical protein
MALSPLFNIYDPQGLAQDQLGLGLPQTEEEILGLVPIRKRQPQVADLLPEEEKTTLLRQLANAGSSGLSGFGWALDTPGAVVRGLLSGGPGKALSALWEDSEQRVTGRELARQYGLAGSEDNWSNFAGGLLAEIALDPLSYVGLGLLGRGAKTAAAKTAEKAGLMTGDIGLLAKQKGMGTAQFMRESTPQTLIDMAGDAAEQAAAKAKWEEYAGAAAEELLGQPLTRTNRISIPGLVEGSADLYGKTAGDWLAKTSDSLGDYARAAPVLGPVVRGAQAIFDPRVMGFTDEKGQYIARRLTEGQRREMARVRQDIADAMVDASFDIPDNLFRDPKFFPAVRNAIEEQWSQITDPDMQRALASPGGQNLLAWMKARIAEEPDLAKSLGIPLTPEKLPNDIGWFPRQQAEIDSPRYADGYQPKVNRSRRGTAIGGVREGGTASRRDYNRAFPAWVLDKMATDKDLQEALRKATNYDGPLRAFANDAQAVIDDWLARNVPDWDPGGNPFGYLADEFEGDELLKRTQDMYVGLADSLRRTPLQAAEQGIPKFGNSLNDFSSYLMNRGRMRANANTLLDIAAEEFAKGGDDVLLRMADSVPGGTHIALPDALKALGFTEDAVPALAQRMGEDADELSRMSMSKDLVDRLNERMVTARTPREAEGLWKAYQGFTDSFKTLALASPARHVRDAYSGAFASATQDGFAFRDWWAGTQVAGGNYAGLSKRLQNSKGYRVEDLFPGDVVVGKPGASLPAGYTLVTEEQLAEARARKFLKAAGGQGLTSGTVADDLGRQASNLQVNEAFPGQAGGLFRNVFDKPLFSLRTWNPFATRGRTSNPNMLLDLSDRAASFTDAGNRLGTFLNRVRKGDSPEAAKALTDLTQVLYGPENFTSFERDFLTKIFPFYRFQKGITPFVAKELVERPYGLTGQSMRAINRGSEPSEDQFTPEYLRQSAAIPIDASSIFGVKTPGVQRFLTNIDLPHESLLNLFTPGVGNTFARRVSDSLMKTGSNILGQSNPILKGPLEGVLNRQFYSGRQLSDLYSMLEHDLGSLNPYLGPWGRTAEQILVNAPGGSRLLGLTRQVRDNRISPAERAAKLAFNTLTGMKFQDVDQDKTLRLAARTTLNDLLDAAPGVSTYENLFIKPEDLVKLSDTEQRQYLLYRVLQSEAAKRARDQKKMLEDPLAQFGIS